MVIEFYKYQGAANDFLIVDQRAKKNGSDTPIEDWTAKAASVCHRRKGVGADGIILLADVGENIQVTFINADGSIAENCGNGMRCVGRYLLDKGELTMHSPEIYVGERCMEVQAAEGEIEVEMGALTISQAELMDIPKLGPCKVTKADIGNPHLLVDARHLRLSRADLKGMGKGFGVLAKEYNIGFVLSLSPSLRRDYIPPTPCLQRRGNETLDVAVLERGAGWTAACASGACAAVGAMIDWGEVAIGDTISVKQAGGQISVNIRKEAGTWQACQRGPAFSVFEGQLDLSDFYG